MSERGFSRCSAGPHAVLGEHLSCVPAGFQSEHSSHLLFGEPQSSYARAAKASKAKRDGSPKRAPRSSLGMVSKFHG